MMSFTNRAQDWHGNTTSVTVRLPAPVVDFIDANLDEIFIRNRSEFLQHWAQVGMLVMESQELADALDWALSLRQPDVLTPPHVAVNTTVEQEAAVGIVIPLDPTPQVYTQPAEEAIEWARSLPETTEFPDLDPEVAVVYDDMLEKFRGKIR